MIKLNVNNEMTMELIQEINGEINVDVVSADGEVEYTFFISQEDMIIMINEYQHKNNII